MENSYLSALSALFSNKGNMAPITEKAIINFNLKQENTINREQRLHYFAIGHAFKQIDTKAIFEYELDEELQKEEPTQFLALQKKEFTVRACLNFVQQ